MKESQNISKTVVLTAATFTAGLLLYRSFSSWSGSGMSVAEVNLEKFWDYWALLGLVCAINLQKTKMPIWFYVVFCICTLVSLVSLYFCISTPAGISIACLFFLGLVPTRPRVVYPDRIRVVRVATFVAMIPLGILVLASSLLTLPPSYLSLDSESRTVELAYISPGFGIGHSDQSSVKIFILKAWGPVAAYSGLSDELWPSCKPASKILFGEEHCKGR